MSDSPESIPFPNGPCVGTFPRSFLGSFPETFLTLAVLATGQLLTTFGGPGDPETFPRTLADSIGALEKVKKMRTLDLRSLGGHLDCKLKLWLAQSSLEWCCFV